MDRDRRYGWAEDRELGRDARSDEDEWRERGGAYSMERGRDDDDWRARGSMRGGPDEGWRGRDPWLSGGGAERDDEGWRSRDDRGGPGYGRMGLGERGGWGSSHGMMRERERGGGGERDDRGPHFGKGPKGYRRSDERIREEVSEVIARQGWIDASDVEVTVQNGEVRLSGTIDQRAHKRRIELMIEDLPGVEDVHNEIRVKRSQSAAGIASHAGSDAIEAPRTTGRNARTS